MKYTYLALLLLILAACGNSNKNKDNRPFVKEEGMVWNTTFHVTYQGNPALSDSVRAVLGRVGKSLSVFDENSLVSLVNRQDSTPVNNDFIRVYVMSKKIYNITDGAFDPALSPLITAWGFGPGHKATADTLHVDSLLRYSSINKTRILHDALIKDDIRTQFNFSAIAKGYGCDAVGDMFKKNGVKNFLIEIGGEILASGINPEGGDWSVSIDKPIISDSTIVHESQVVISFTDMGLATSGNYRNYHKTDSGIYGHTISTATGRPVATDVLSATVLSSKAMEADALATAFMAMGRDKTIELNKRLQLPVMLICPDTVWMSDEFQKLIPKE